MSADPAVELAARMPWTVAQEESWWEVTGSYHAGEAFINCLARVLPQYITGPDAAPQFQVLTWGDDFLSSIVPASAITRARELIFVEALDPLTAYYADDQPVLDAALARRDEEAGNV